MRSEYRFWFDNLQGKGVEKKTRRGGHLTLCRGLRRRDKEGESPSPACSRDANGFCLLLQANHRTSQRCRTATTEQRSARRMTAALSTLSEHRSARHTRRCDLEVKLSSDITPR